MLELDNAGGSSIPDPAEASAERSIRREFESAIDLFGKGMKEEAAGALIDLIERHPGYADAYEALGMIYYKMDRLDDAVLWTERLALMRPEHAMAHTNLSVFYMKKGMKEKAEEEKAKATVLRFSKGSP